MAARPTPRSDDRYTQEEHEERDNTSIAVIRNDLKYLRADVADIKAKLEASSTTYLTKNESDYKFAELALRVQSLENVNENEAKDRKFYKQTAIGAIISNVITLVLGALLAIRFYGGH